MFSSQAHLTKPVAAQRREKAGVALIGQSSQMLALHEAIAIIAPRRCTVIIAGETGTGKELVARCLHSQSGRRNQPFVPVDCSAMTDSLFEAQLFGHVRGAFTGAMRDSLGFIRAADGGTLFLDEIGELSLPLQAKLLRAIQERCVVPVGHTHPHPVDVRVLAATHRDLAGMVSDGTFREDLYFRLNVVTLRVPPLHQRGGDVLLLAQHFLAQQADFYAEPQRQLSAEAVAALHRYNWPGNVRELANAIEHAYVLSSGALIELTDLPIRLQETATPGLSGSEASLLLSDVERRTIVEALKRSGWRKAAAARLLGMNIQRLTRRIAHLHIRMP